MKKKDEKGKMEEMHQHKVVQMIERVQGSVGLVHKITKPTPWRGGAQFLEKEEEDARLLDRCEAKVKEWATHWQCDEDVQNLEDKPWKNEELRKWEEALGFENVQIKDRKDVMVSTPQFRWKWGDKLLNSRRRWSRVANGRNKPAQRCSS